MGRLFGRLLDEMQRQPAAIPAIRAIHDRDNATESQESQESQRGQIEKNGRGKDANPDTSSLRSKLMVLASTDYLPVDLVHGLSDADVNACKGETDATLTAYLRALAASRAMDAGQVPPGWGNAVKAFCDGCGPVLLWDGVPSRVKACPWCFRRKAGKGIPRPKVSCRDCIHFTLHAMNPQAGGGDCLAGHDGHWPMQVHRCDAWRPDLSESKQK